MAEIYYCLQVTSDDLARQKRLDKAREQRVKDLFDNSQFDWELLQLAIDQYFEKEKAGEKEEEKVEEKVEE